MCINVLILDVSFKEVIFPAELGKYQVHPVPASDRAPPPLWFVVGDTELVILVRSVRDAFAPWVIDGLHYESTI